MSLIMMLSAVRLLITSLVLYTVPQGLSPQQLYEAMLGPEDSRPTNPRTIPEEMPKGSGRLSLTEFCSRYNRDTVQAEAILEKVGYKVDPAASLKDIAVENGVDALDLLDALRQGVDQ